MYRGVAPGFSEMVSEMCSGPLVALCVHGGGTGTGPIAKLQVYLGSNLAGTSTVAPREERSRIVPPAPSALLLPASM